MKNKNNTPFSCRFFLLFLLIQSLFLDSIALSGEKPFDFTLSDINGKKVRLKDYTGKDVIFLNFWATWCAPCLNEILFLQKLSDRYSKDGFSVMAINVDELKDYAKVKGFARSKGLTITILLDPSTEVFSLYNPSKVLPYSIIIRRDGTIESRNFGYNPEDENKIEEKIRGLLEEKR